MKTLMLCPFFLILFSGYSFAQVGKAVAKPALPDSVVEARKSIVNDMEQAEEILRRANKHSNEALYPEALLELAEKSQNIEILLMLVQLQADRMAKLAEQNDSLAFEAQLAQSYVDTLQAMKLASGEDHQKGFQMFTSDALRDHEKSKWDEKMNETKGDFYLMVVAAVLVLLVGGGIVVKRIQKVRKMED